MQISSSSDTQSILAIARQTAMDKRTKDQSGDQTASSNATGFASGGVSYSQGYTSFQSSLAQSALSPYTATAAADTPIAGETGLNRDLLTKSDWDLVQKTTGLTPANDKTGGWYDADGNEVYSGSAVEQAQGLVFAMADIRSDGSEDSLGNMSKMTGDITAAQLQQYASKYRSSAAQGAMVEGLDKAASILNA